MRREIREQTLAGDIAEIREIIARFESLIDRFEERMAESQAGYRRLLSEGDALVREAKARLHEIHEEARRCGVEPLPDVPIRDEKLKSAWLALYQFHDGATADEVAELILKHRTTVSTYLNILTSMDYAVKERRGHEIYYRAVLPRGSL